MCPVSSVVKTYSVSVFVSDGRKALYTYPVLFALVFVYHAFSFSLLKYLIPLLLLAVPYAMGFKVGFRLAARDILSGVVASVLVLLPFWFFSSPAGKVFFSLSSGALLFQLLGVAFPEEVYFRGVLQEKLGNRMGGVLIVSALFSLMHVPRLIFYGDPYSVLTFFPSLVMGFLYMRTSNIVPSTIFHFASNVVFLGLL